MRSDLYQELFIPRTEYSVFPIVLPPLSKKEHEQAVINRLRGLYPGNLDDKYIVILPNGKRGNYLALVFFDSLRDDPLSISTLAAGKLCKKGRQNCIIVWGGWVEYIVLDEGKIISSMVALAEERLSEQLTSQAADWFSLNENLPIEANEEKNSTVKVFCTATDFPAEEAMVTESFIFHYIVLEKAILTIPRSSWSCFPERLPQVKRRRLMFAIAACVLAVIFALCLRNWYGHQEAARAARRDTERLIALEAAERKGKEEKLAALTMAWEEQLAEQRVGVYSVIETLASCLSPAVRLSSATLKEDGSFRLDGVSINAIAALDDLQSHPEINETVIGTIVWDGGHERFTVDGTVTRRPLFPEDSLNLEEKISWYEATLALYVKNEPMPETAAAAAHLIQSLLMRNYLKTTRFRYLDANNGWIIESAVSGTGMQMVQAIKEADDALSMRVISLETRNRQDGLDAVITFFVRGPGLKNSSRDYEVHPSLTRIAAFYGVLPGRFSAVSVQTQQQTETGLPVAPPTVSTMPSLLEYVGYIGIFDGRRFIYVKDTRSGELYRLVEGEGSYSYRINSTGLITATLGGSSSPVEVRRNDGF